MSEKDLSEINIVYNINKEKIAIFGSIFVLNNKNKCKMVIDNREYKITEEFNVKKNNKKKLNIKLKHIDIVTNMSNMFYKCSSLLSLPDISNWNTDNVTNMSNLFEGCSSLSSLPDISNWNTNKVTNMSYMFSGCKKSLNIPSKFKK